MLLSSFASRIGHLYTLIHIWSKKEHDQYERSNASFTGLDSHSSLAYLVIGVAELTRQCESLISHTYVYS